MLRLEHELGEEASSIIEYVPKFMLSRNYSETLKQIYRYSQCNVELYGDKRGHLTPLNFFKVPFVLVMWK